MSENKIRDLALKLHAKTLARELTWTSTSEPGRFQLAFPQNVVLIETWMDEDIESVRYRLVILNTEGAVVETIYGFEVIPDDYRRGETLLEEIHDMARRTALGVDTALDQILEALDG